MAFVQEFQVINTQFESVTLLPKVGAHHIAALDRYPAISSRRKSDQYLLCIWYSRRASRAPLHVCCENGVIWGHQGRHHGAM
jgi:hypothetical protein